MQCFNSASLIRPLLIASLLAQLAACSGGDSSSSTDYISTGAAPTWTMATDIGVNDNIVIRFDESIDTASLSLSGSLADLVASQSWSRVIGTDDTLTLTPSSQGWYSGIQDLGISVQDRSGQSAANTSSLAVRLKFDNFHAASVVIGQTDFSGTAANQGGSAAADTLNNPSGNPVMIDGRLWIADTSNNRVLGYDGIPSANGASASYVIGQSTFTGSGGGTSASMFVFPSGITQDGSAFYVSDSNNNRVLVYDGVPLAAPGTASHVVGQVDLTSNVSGCSASYLQNPASIIAVAGKLIIGDWTNNRVLIWNTAPTSANDVPADIVLGQSDFTHCTKQDDNQDNIADLVPTARTLSSPTGVWSDGTRLVVTDAAVHRVLIWNSFPTSNFQPADIVLGQKDFSLYSPRDDNGDIESEIYPTARTFSAPTEVWSNGLQLFLTDQGDNRILIWDTFPTTNFQPADAVLGQASFSNFAPNDDDQNKFEDATPSARTMNNPWGLSEYRNKLLVTDTGNQRVLVFDSK